MNGVHAVQSRIAELQLQMRALAPVTPRASVEPGQRFDTVLQAQLASTEPVTGTAPVTPVAPSGVALGAQAARPVALRPNATAAMPGITEAVARYDHLFAAATSAHGLPQGLLAAVAQTESAGDASAVSHAGAIGLMQIMPGTARGLGVDPRDPAQAVDGAARLLATHLRDFGSVDLALAAYNAGPGAVRKHGGIPPYSETQNYVRKVNALLERGMS